jgi:heat shock protein HslJ
MLPAMTTALEGTSWVLDVAALGLTDAEGTPTAEFGDGTVSGSTGCNRYTGGFTKARSKVSVGSIATTRRAGSPTAMAVEHEYLARLARVASFRIKGDALTLVDATGDAVLVFAAWRQTIEGAWEITGYLMASGTGFSSTVIDSAPSVVFAADGTTSGGTGCNTFRGRYEIDGATISIGPLITTRMACLPERAEQEAGILKSLDAAASFTLAPGTATLLNAEGQLVLSLTAA